MKKFVISLSIFLLLQASFGLKAQIDPRTIMTVTLSNKSFPERSDWGESFRILSLEFWVNNIKIGSTSSGLSTSVNTIFTNDQFPLNAAEVTSKIIIIGIHHTWGIWGDDETFVTKEYPLCTQNIDQSGIAGERTFSEFIELPMVVDWQFTYQIGITPFQPRIISTNEDRCYDFSSEFTLVQNNPSFFEKAGLHYEWQYGFQTAIWNQNPVFDAFIENVGSELSGSCSGGYGISWSNIYNAVVISNYSFMNDHYDLYLDQTEYNRYLIADYLLQGILGQNSLTYDEQEFLIDNFVTAVLYESYLPAPYERTFGVSTWNTLGWSSSINGAVSFIPGNIIDASSEKVKIYFRVRAVAGTEGPFSSEFVIFVRPKAPTFKIKSVPSCVNRPSGSIEISGLSGVVPGAEYQCYIKNMSLPAEEPLYTYGPALVVSNLNPGSYKIKIYYADPELTGCAIHRDTIISGNPSLEYGYSVKGASCPEKSDGQVFVNVTSHYGACNFTLNNITNTTGVFDNLDNGSYPLVVKDACYINPPPINVYIPEPESVSIEQIIKHDPTCFSTPNGAMEVYLNGGDKLYSIQLFDASGTQIRTASGPHDQKIFSFGVLPGGNYTVQARSGECAWKTSGTNLAVVSPVDFSTIVKQVDCFGDNTGRIEVTASGGNYNYNYSINNNPSVSSSVFTSLLSGTYQVTVKSTAAACNDTKTGTVIVETAPKIEITFPDAVNPSCFEKDDGRITALVTGGTGGYNYTWTSNVMYFPEPGMNVITGLIAGNYSLSVADSKNCTVSTGLVLTDPPELVVETAEPADVACFGGNGSILIHAMGGTGSYQYSTSESSGYGISSQLIVPAGDHYVYVKDANGCVASYSDLVTVTGPDSQLDFTFSSATYNGYNIACYGDASGAVSIQASGGNGMRYDGSEYEGYVYSVAGLPGITEPHFTGLYAGSNTIRVTDGRGCTVTKTAILTQPEPVSLNLLSIDPVKCFGASTGKIFLSAAGGIPNTYKYKLDGAETLSTGVFENLFADTYEIEVSDINGCSSSLFATVASINPPIEVSIEQKDVRCFGEGNGEINTTVTGGAGGFSYAWEKKEDNIWLPGIGNTESMINVTPGIYRVRATDTESCFEYGIAEIREPALLQISDVSSADIVCSGENGRITIDATGGSASYTYTCSSDNGTIYNSINPEFSLPAGLYSTSVSDRNGCLAEHPVSLRITGPDTPLDFTSSLSSYNGYPVSCHGRSDGTIIVNPSGGNGSGYSGYSFSLSGNPETSVNNFTELAAGSYDIRVTDGRGCSTQKTVVLNQPQPVAISLLGTVDVKCFGEPTGEIAVETTGGVQGIYSYRLNGSDVSFSGVFSGLAAGSYVVGASDRNGCSVSLTANIAHKNPPISTSVIPVNVRCYGESSGEVRVEATGGSGGFTHTWEARMAEGWLAIGQGTNRSNLTAGLYRIRSADSDLCFRIDTAEVKEPQPLMISNVKIHDAICFGDQGSLEIEASGGNSGYAFQYTPNNNRIFYYDYIPGNPVSPGIYGLKVTDSRGCTAEGSGIYHLTSPPVPLSLESQLSGYADYNVSCHGNNDGWIKATPFGGNGFDYTGYTYRLSGREPQSEKLFTGLEAGSFELTVTDGRGCSLSKIIVLDEPESDISLKVASLKKPVCVYDSSGVISLNAQGGSLPYEFSVNGGSYSRSTEFASLPVNMYTFKVRDVNGCAETFDTLLQSQVSEMKISGEIADVKCFGESSGSVNISITGGAEPFNYLWKENGLRAVPATNLATGKYTIQVTDSAGCKSEKEFFVSQPEKPLRLFVKGTQACVGLKDGEITAMPDGGTPPYRFDLNRKSDFMLPSVISVFSGNHTVYVADRNDCISESRILIDVRNTMPDINFMLATSRYELDTLVVIDVSVPPPDRVTWEFSPDAVVIDTTRGKASVRYNQAGLYPVKMTGLFGTCAYTVEKILNIAPFDPSVIGDDKDKKGIKSLKISPNPNDGTFELLVGLHTKQQVTVKIFDLYSRLVFHEILPPDLLFVKQISLPETVMPGTYILRVTAENDSRSSMFVISE